MAHKQQMRFVGEIAHAFPAFFRQGRVLEIGSLDINSSIRGMFPGTEYTGIDVAPGPGVDIVRQGQDHDAPDGYYDAVVCCEVMEHNPHWAATFRNMSRMTRAGGLTIMTCAARGRPDHGTARTEPEASPLTVGLGWTYYRNLEAADFEAEAPAGDAFSVWRYIRNYDSCDVYFAGFRVGAPAPDGAAAALRAIRNRLALRNLTRSRAWRNRVRTGLLGRD
jgi:SAM-dependent methyltransferase